jgi:hypothetical protein
VSAEVIASDANKIGEDVDMVSSSTLHAWVQALFTIKLHQQPQQDQQAA